MIENLNIAGGTAISADDTDVSSDYITNFTTSNNLTKDDTNNMIVLPESSISGFNTRNYSYVYNSGNKTTACNDATPCYSYYSWDAATLGSGRTLEIDNTDAEQSICPKGWRLPRIRTTSDTNWQTDNDFYALAHQYGLDSTTSTSELDDGFYAQAGPNTIPDFLLAGSCGVGSFTNGGTSGHYWSSTSSSYSSTGYAHNFAFSGSDVRSATQGTRRFGYSIRCLFQQ